MIIKKQQGVALVQVLLITSMILILVVQLSKDAKSQVRTSQINKDKVSALVLMKTALEKTKYELLSLKNGEEQTFFGQAKQVDGITVRIQDEAGLLSLPYGIEQVARYLGVKEDDHKLIELQKWQGLFPIPTGPSGRYKNGLLQYVREVQSIPGWEAIDLPEELVTYLPTPYFNPLNAPDSVVNKLLERKIAKELIALRRVGDLREARRLFDTSTPGVLFENGNVFRIKAEEEILGAHISRSEKIEIDVNSPAVIQVLEY